jgi:hypothetical protein
VPAELLGGMDGRAAAAKRVEHSFQGFKFGSM